MNDMSKIIFTFAVFAICINAQASQQKPSVKIEGGHYDGDVLIIKPNEPIKFKFQKGYAVSEPSIGNTIDVSARTYKTPKSIKDIPADAMLSKYLHCGFTNGANDPEKPMIFFFDDMAKPDFKNVGDEGSGRFDREFGVTTWLRPNSNNEVTVSIDPTLQDFKGPKDIYISFSGSKSVTHKFYGKKAALDSDDHPLDVEALNLKYSEELKSGNKDLLIEECKSPDIEIHARLEN
jgi:hypothetical protein